MQIKSKNRIFAKSKNLQIFYIPFLVVLTFVLIFFNKTDYFLINQLKSFSIDFVQPVTKVIVYPIHITSKTINYFNDMQNAKENNLKLQEEIQRLKKWQTLALKNERENIAYKKLLNATSSDLIIIKTAAVLSFSPEKYLRTIILNAGSNNQIENNLAVINERGLIGKIIHTSKSNSKVLLLNDKNSSIPVKSMNGEFYAVIHGSDDGNFLISSFTKENSKPIIGDILITSGNANIYPKDILVGKIVEFSNDTIKAIPFVDFKNLEFVQVIKQK